jgi:hypothetical protein
MLYHEIIKFSARKRFGDILQKPVLYRFIDGIKQHGFLID